MKKRCAILFLFSVGVLILGGCSYYYPMDYDPYDYPVNYGFIAPFNYYSPLGYYSYAQHPYEYPYEYYYYYPSTRYYLGESPEGYRGRQFEPGERPGGER